MPSIPKRTSILYQNEARDITLIDIPTSIAIAQGRPDATLRSTPPLEEPYIIENEPKNPKARNNHAYYATALHDKYKAIITDALTTLRAHVSPLPWCIPRTLMNRAPESKEDAMDVDNDPENNLTRCLREWAASKAESEPRLDFEQMMANLASGVDATSTATVTCPWLMSYRPARPGTSDQEFLGTVPQQEPWASSFHNPEHHAVELTIAENVSQAQSQSQAQGTARGAEYRFNIPPRATLFLSDCKHADAFRASFREVTEEYRLPRHFDFILLDPPWPSGSAKRKGNYEQVGGMTYMMKLLSAMDIDNYIEHDGLVGIWITNKQSLREYVLGPGGLFEQWNLGLIEEWIWVKATVKGEPMFSIDSNWRKPYEILLLGRAAPNSWTTMEPAPSVRRRVIAAVPDVHSRKPCLKELIDTFMPDPDDYSALEIFSRYLVAGWTAWGNEALKFNWEGYWASEGEIGATPI